MFKHVCLIALLITASLGSGHELLRKAEAAYDAKKYKEAIAAYGELVDQGYRSYQLYYNLGNAYFRNNQIGRAIYNYELARKLEPNDEDVRINLAIANSKTIDKIESRENFFVDAMRTNILSSFSTRTWGWLSITALAFSAMAFLFILFTSRVRSKRIFLGASTLFFVVFIVFYFCGLAASRAKYQNKFAVILSREVRIVNEPNSDASSKFTLHEGTKLRVVDVSGDWLLIKLDNGNEGWIKTSDVGII